MKKLSKSEKFMLKYRTNVVFRKNHIEAVAKYKQKKAKEKKLQKLQLKLDRKQWMVFKVGGKDVGCCRITYLSSALGRTSKRIREWENEGRFPKTIRYNNQRYYTKKHYNMILRYWRQYANNLDMFFAKVCDAWNKCY